MAERKAESILQDEKKCWFCLAERGLHLHHIFYGVGKRKISDKNGFTAWLCAKHHNMSDFSVHFNKEMDLNLKKACQLKFEKMGHSREDFLKLIGRNYLD